jgi:hypothetical protein
MLTAHNSDLSSHPLDNLIWRVRGPNGPGFVSWVSSIIAPELAGPSTSVWAAFSASPAHSSLVLFEDLSFCQTNCRRGAPPTPASRIAIQKARRETPRWFRFRLARPGPQRRPCQALRKPARGPTSGTKRSAPPEPCVKAAWREDSATSSAVFSAYGAKAASQPWREGV